MVFAHAIDRGARPLGVFKHARRASVSLRKQRLQAQRVRGSADGERKSDGKAVEWQDKLGSLVSQAGAWWSSMRQRPAEVGIATPPEADTPGSKQEPEPLAKAGTSSAGSGSMQQVGQSQQLSFRQPVGNIDTKQGDVVTASGAADAAPVTDQAPDSTGGRSESDSPSTFFSSWDAVAMGSSEAMETAAEDNGTGWAGLEPDPPPRRRVAGNVLFSSLLAGIGIASALALQRYGSWRQQNPLVAEGQAAPVAHATQPADARLVPANITAAAAAHDGNAGAPLRDAGPAARQWDAHDAAAVPTAADAQGQTADSSSGELEANDAPPSSLGAHTKTLAPGGVAAAGEPDHQHGGSTKHDGLAPPHDAQGDRGGQEANALLAPASSEAPGQFERKFPIRTREGAAALERMRRLQQRRQQLYQQLQERQEQRYRQAFGAAEEAEAEGAQPAATPPQRQQGEAGEPQGDPPPTQPVAGQPAGDAAPGQVQGGATASGAAGVEAQAQGVGAGEEDEELHLQDRSVRWLLRELEREEQREAAALAEQAAAQASAPRSMRTAAVQQRAAAAHRAAAAAARHAQRATAAFSTAAEAATAAANSAQRAAAAAARAQVAVERRWAVEAEQAAAQAEQAAAEGAAAAQKASVASARSVMAKHDVRRQAQLAAQAAELTRPLTVREQVTAAWQLTSRSVRAAPGTVQRVAAQGRASVRQALAASQTALQRSNSAVRGWAGQAGRQLRETAGHVRTALSGTAQHAGELASSLRARFAVAVGRFRSPRQPPP